jgi:hypothetical protein
MQLRAGLPENTRDVFACGEQKAADVLIGLPIYRRGNEKVLEVVDLLQGNDTVWRQALLSVLIE